MNINARPPRSPRLLILVAALLALAFVARDYMHRNTPGEVTARAIVAGESRSQAPNEEDAEDQNLEDDERAAGAIWARAHPSQICPDQPRNFHAGCIQADGAQTQPAR